MEESREVNFDGLVGPTHNYAGLAYGNMAAMTSKGRLSNPREAALKGLQKMKQLMDLDVLQAVIPPQERPHLPTLRHIGFRGKDEDILRLATKKIPEIFFSVCSASSMWTANAATVSPGCDTGDGKVHITVANLITHSHRAIEAVTTGRLLRGIFRDESLFSLHPPLRFGGVLCDEGAANHLRLAKRHGAPGIELFVYGRRVTRQDEKGPTRFPARQTREASEAVARRHLLDPDRTLFIRQNPCLIDEGVFHNDVISVANEKVFIYHRQAFAEGETVIKVIQRLFGSKCGSRLILIEVDDETLSPKEAVKTYLFNSQIVTLPKRGMGLIAPVECRENAKTRRIIDRILADDENPIKTVRYVDLRQSMRNGGGPACLRLRVVLNREELSGVHPGIWLTPALYETLKAWVRRNYRDRLSPEDLAGGDLLMESRTALDELTQILDLGSIYDFQV